MRRRPKVLAKEGEFFLRHLERDVYGIALDLDGENLTSPDLAALLEEKGNREGKEIAFLIGGSLGLSAAVKKRCRQKIAFGRATFPHQLIRVFCWNRFTAARKSSRMSRTTNKGKRWARHAPAMGDDAPFSAYFGKNGMLLAALMGRIVLVLHSAIFTKHPTFYFAYTSSPDISTPHFSQFAIKTTSPLFSSLAIFVSIAIFLL